MDDLLELYALVDYTPAGGEPVRGVVIGRTRERDTHYDVRTSQLGIVNHIPADQVRPADVRRGKLRAVKS